MFQPGDIIQWRWTDGDRQQTCPLLRVLGTSYDNYYYRVIDTTTNTEYEDEWEVTGASSGYWKQHLTTPSSSAMVTHMDRPEVGDIWRWDDQWTVILVKQVPVEEYQDERFVFVGIALEDGWQGRWEFGGSINNLWEKMA